MALLAFGLSLALSPALSPGLRAGEAGEPGPFIANPLSGVALDGYDPVSYFTEAAPQLGHPDFEWVWGGVPWYFASSANRDVFMRAPTVYAPQFGGHCLLGLSRGYLSDGDPRLFVVYRQRLYLFYSVGNREAFLLAPQAAIEASQGRWPALRTSLPPG